MSHVKIAFGTVEARPPTARHMGKLAHEQAYDNESRVGIQYEMEAKQCLLLTNCVNGNPRNEDRGAGVGRRKVDTEVTLVAEVLGCPRTRSPSSTTCGRRVTISLKLHI